MSSPWRHKRISNRLIWFLELGDGVEYQVYPHAGQFLGTAYRDGEIVGSVLRGSIPKVEEDLGAALILGYVDEAVSVLELTFAT